MDDEFEAPMDDLPKNLIPLNLQECTKAIYQVLITTSINVKNT